MIKTLIEILEEGWVKKDTFGVNSTIYGIGDERLMYNHTQKTFDLQYTIGKDGYVLNVRSGSQITFSPQNVTTYF